MVCVHRYSAFIPLYPIGMFLGEMPLMYRSLPYLRERHLYSLSLPNSLNFAFHYHIFVQVRLCQDVLPVSRSVKGFAAFTQ